MPSQPAVAAWCFASHNLGMHSSKPVLHPAGSPRPAPARTSGAWARSARRPPLQASQCAAPVAQPSAPPTQPLQHLTAIPHPIPPVRRRRPRRARERRHPAPARMGPQQRAAMARQGPSLTELQRLRRQRGWTAMRPQRPQWLQTGLARAFMQGRRPAEGPSAGGIPLVRCCGSWVRVRSPCLLRLGSRATGGTVNLVLERLCWRLP